MFFIIDKLIFSSFKLGVRCRQKKSPNRSVEGFFLEMVIVT